MSVAYCIASSKQGMAANICRLHSKLNHNFYGNNHKETRVEQKPRKLWVCSLLEWCDYRGICPVDV